MSDIEDELNRYQIPPGTLDSDTVGNYRRLYLKMSQGKVFFRGYVQPEPELRARIYRTVDILKYYNFITLNTTYGMVIKCPPLPLGLEIEEVFDRLLLEERVFVPKGCDKLVNSEFHYYRRLLSSFVRDHQIPAKIVMNVELDRFFLFLSYFVDPPARIENLWKQYLQGGIQKTIAFTPDRLISVCENFPWADRVRWECYPGEPDIIRLTVRTRTKRDFDERIGRIRHRPPQIKLYRYNLLDVLQNENSGFGLCRLLEGPTIIVPLIGTPYAYVDGPVTDMYTYKSTSNDEIEIYSQDRFSDMDYYRRAALVEGPSGKWFSFLSVVQGNRVDPSNREDFSPETNKEIDNVLREIQNGVGRYFLLGFPPIRHEPELFTQTRISTVAFYLKLRPSRQGLESGTWFWEIPILEFHEQVTEYAIGVLAQKWSDRTIFGRYSIETDPLLTFCPRALEIFEESSTQPWSNDPVRQAVRLHEEAKSLSQIF